MIVTLLIIALPTIALFFIGAWLLGLFHYRKKRPFNKSKVLGILAFCLAASWFVGSLIFGILRQ